MALPDRLTPVLEVSGLHAGYGMRDVVSGIDLRLFAGTVVSIIGAAGSGKSAVLLALAGALRPHKGSITFADRAVRRIPVFDSVRRGIVLVPQGRAIFGSLTVRENLEIGAWVRRDRWSIASEVDAFLERFPKLGTAAAQPAWKLDAGDGQILAIARALMSKPQLLMLDEPSAELDAADITHVLRVIRQVCVEDMPVLLAERPAPFAVQLADYAYLLEGGRIVREGPAREFTL
ncbi:MAG TPA: ATP-binding cassette domain-containing protein [Candidatus Eremiobacteraceae bacterium]|nr:ATP-binding cassette domain-containing protein [Candidatus Eremiobacteraceae bacterium]